MRILKRLILIFGFVPAFILITLYWVISGKDIDMDKFIKWYDQ